MRVNPDLGERSVTSRLVGLVVGVALPCSLGVTGLLLALESIPPNDYVGYRTESSRASRDEWYELNQVAGLALLVAAFAAGATNAWLWRRRRGTSTSPLTASVLVAAAATLLAALVTVVYDLAS